MRTEKILPETVYIDNVKETKELFDFYVPKFIRNYEKQPTLSKDWNIHTDYHKDSRDDVYEGIEDIDFGLAEEVYFKYIKNFISHYFPEILDPQWEFDGIWYNIYGKNQEAEVHTHAGHSFSLVHYLQYEKGSHSPIVFVNSYTKEEASINIEDGDIIMFKSDIFHRVGSNHSDKNRISIALNINVPGFVTFKEEVELTKEEIELQKYCDSLQTGDNE